MRTAPLFKFRSLAGQSRERTEDIIVNRRLWWATADSFNDPFDCAPVTVFEGSKLQKEVWLRKLIAKTMSSVPRHVRKRLERGSDISQDTIANAMVNAEQGYRSYGVCSFAGVPDHPLMWAHYADSHRGICLQFEPYRRTESTLSLGLDVEYSADRPVINVRTISDHTDLYRDVLLIKGEVWEYEREVRCIDVWGGAGFRSYLPGELTGVIFGHACAEQDRQQLAELVQSHHRQVRLQEMALHDKTFDLVLRPWGG